MVDTIRFSIKLSESEYQAIQQKGKEQIINDRTLGTEIKRRYNDNIFVGSYDYRINYWCYSENKLFLEFSVPKYVYGHNIYLLYPSQLEQALDGVYHELLNHFGAFPHYKNWIIQRLDVCYAWRYQDQATAERILEALRMLEYPRKLRQPYKTGVMWKGGKYSPKFYLKLQDFRKHDLQRLIKKDAERAYQLLELCSGVLRFEITFRKFSLDYLFENKSSITYKDLLENDFIPKTLTEYLNKLINNFDKESMQSEKIAKCLINIHGKANGMKRYFFYELFFSPEHNKRDVINKLYSRTTIWRYRKDIEAADINILPFYDVNTDISIPSPFVVNPEPAPFAPAEERVTLF